MKARSFNDIYGFVTPVFLYTNNQEDYILRKYISKDPSWGKTIPMGLN